VNEYDLTASQEEKYNTFFRLASGELSEEELTARLREWMTVSP
jgi:prophage maintenance system killer protein